MRERDRITVKEWHDELAEIERAEKEARERPIKEAERALNETAKQLREVQRANVLKLKDDEVYISPELKTARMTQADAEDNNLKAVNQFCLECHEYREHFKTQDNADKILDYLTRNGVNIFDVSILRAAFVKLRDLDLLTEKPVPDPSLETVHDTELEPAPVAAKEPELIDGWNESGEPCKYTQNQLNRMDSESYKRALRLGRLSPFEPSSLALPTVGPGKGLR